MGCVMMSLMPLASVQAFDFIKSTQSYINEADFPHNASTAQKLNQYTRNLRINRADFLSTHRGTTASNYDAARQAALACNNRALQPGFVTDGVPAKDLSGGDTVYRASTILDRFPSDIWQINYHQCGRSIIAIINSYPVIRADDTFDYLTVELVENTVTGVFTAWISSYEEGEDYITTSDDMKDINAVMGRLQMQIRSLTGVVHMGISIQGISQKDTASHITPGVSVDHMVWMNEIARVAGLSKDDWVSGSMVGKSENKMLIDPYFNRDGMFMDAYFMIVRLANGTYVLLEFDREEARANSALDLVHTLIDIRG